MRTPVALLIAFGSVICAQAGERQIIIASSMIASINAAELCAAPPPRVGKRIVVAGGCVTVRQQRAGQRSCEFVLGPDDTLADYDRMLALCKRTELP